MKEISAYASKHCTSVHQVFVQYTLVAIKASFEKLVAIKDSKSTCIYSCDFSQRQLEKYLQPLQDSF